MQLNYLPFCGVLSFTQSDGCDNVVVDFVDVLGVISVVRQIVEGQLAPYSQEAVIVFFFFKFIYLTLQVA